MFDMDGVLIDSVALGLRARKKLLANYDIDLDKIPDPQGESHRAASLKSLLLSVKNHSGVHIDHDEFARIFRNKLRQDLEELDVSVDPKLVIFLDELKQHDINCVIVSSSLNEGIDIKLNILGIRHYFSSIVSGSDVKEHKPHPEPYLYAMKKLNLYPKDCVTFEDSRTGIQSGQDAGCNVICFTKYNPPEDPAPGVITSIKDWDEISYDKLVELIAHST